MSDKVFGVRETVTHPLPGAAAGPWICSGIAGRYDNNTRGLDGRRTAYRNFGRLTVTFDWSALVQSPELECVNIF